MHKTAEVKKREKLPTEKREGTLQVVAGLEKNLKFSALPQKVA